MNEINPKIVFLSESRQTDIILNTDLEIKNYELIRCDSMNRRTGGCVIYISNNINFEVIKNIQIEQTWILIINVKSGFNVGIYGVIYKSPKQNKKNFLKIMDELFEDIIDIRNFNFICGDFNEDLNKKTEYGDKLLSLFNQYNILQIISESTRETNKSSTLIDYVLTNKHDMISYKMNESERISDHNIIKVNIKYNSLYI
jgi:hypothetical protein